jgi:hypothetical protein
VHLEIRPHLPNLCQRESDALRKRDSSEMIITNLDFAYSASCSSSSIHLAPWREAIISSSIKCRIITGGRHKIFPSFQVMSIVQYPMIAGNQPFLSLCTPLASART